MGARVWNNAGNYDANVALVQKFYAWSRCTNEENFQTSTLARAFSDEVDSGWRGKGRRPIGCAYSAADKPARSAKLHCRVHPQLGCRACFCGIPACLAKPMLAKERRLLAPVPLLGFDFCTRGH